MRYNASEGEEFELTVPAEAAGERLDVYLAAHLAGQSRTFVRRLIDDALVVVEPGKAKPAYRLKGGERLKVFLPELVELSAEPEEIPLTFLYEDSWLAVVDKPAGLVVHPAPGHERGTLVNALLFHLRDLSGIGGVLRPGLVHRLDRDTTGCLVVAKHDQAHQELAAQFAARRVEKRYLALTVAEPRPAEGRVEVLLGRHPRHRQLQAVLSEGGRPSLTLYRTLETFARGALVECDLKTGRTHQIRVHLKHLGAPILCDADYGDGRPLTDRAGETLIARQALHARFLAFDHPQTGERLSFESPLPADFAAALAALREGRVPGRKG